MELRDRSLGLRPLVSRSHPGLHYLSVGIREVEFEDAEAVVTGQGEEESSLVTA